MERSFAKCVEIDNSVERLVCFDRTAAELGLVKTVEPVTGVGKWRVSTETSKVDDSTNVFMRVKADAEVQKSRLWSGYPELWIMCRENTTSFFVSYPFFITTDKAYVTYRYDKDRAASRNMNMSTDYKAFGLWSGGSSIPFVKRMFAKRRLLIRVTPHGESAVTSEFDISGLSEAIKPLRKACKW